MEDENRNHSSSILELYKTREKSFLESLKQSLTSIASDNSIQQMFQNQSAPFYLPTRITELISLILHDDRETYINNLLNRLHCYQIVLKANNTEEIEKLGSDMLNNKQDHKKEIIKLLENIKCQIDDNYEKNIQKTKKQNSNLINTISNEFQSIKSIVTNNQEKMNTSLHSLKTNLNQILMNKDLELQSIKDKLQTTEKLVNSLTKENSELKKQLTMSQKNLSRSQDQYTELSEQMECKEKELKELHDLQNKQSKLSTSVQTDIHNEDNFEVKDIDDTNQDINQIKQSLVFASKSLHKKEKENEDLQSTIKQLKKEKANLEKQLQALTSQGTMPKKVVFNEKNVNQNLYCSLEDFESIMHERNKLADQIDQMESSILESEKQNESLQQKLKQTSDLQVQLEETNKSLINIQTQNAELKDKINLLNSQNELLHTNLNSKEKELSDLKSSLEKGQKKSAENSLLVNQKETFIQSLTKENAKLIGQISALTQMNTNSDEDSISSLVQSSNLDAQQTLIVTKLFHDSQKKSQRKIIQYENAIIKITDKLQKIENEKRNVIQQNSKYSNKINSYKEKIKQLNENHLNEMENQKHELESKLQLLQKQNEEIKNENEKKESEIQAKNDIEKKLKTDIRNLSNINESFNQAQTEIQKKDGEIQKKNRLIRTLTTENEKLNSQVAILSKIDKKSENVDQSEIDKFIASSNLESQEISGLTKTINEVLTKRFTEYSQTLENIQNELKRKEEETENLNLQVTKYKTKIDHLTKQNKEEIERMQFEFSNNQKVQTANFQSEIESNQNEIEKLTRSFKKLSDDVNEKEKAIDELETENEQIQKTLSQRSKELNDNKIIMKTLQDHQKGLEEKINDISIENQQLKGELEISELQIHKLDKERKELKKAFKIVSEDHIKLKRKCKEFKKHDKQIIDNLKAENQSFMLKNQDLSQKVEVYFNESKENQEKANSIHLLNQQLSEKLKLKKNQITQQMKLIDKLQKSADSTISELNEKIKLSESQMSEKTDYQIQMENSISQKDVELNEKNEMISYLTRQINELKSNEENYLNENQLLKEKLRKQNLKMEQMKQCMKDVEKEKENVNRSYQEMNEIIEQLRLK